MNVLIYSNVSTDLVFDGVVYLPVRSQSSNSLDNQSVNSFSLGGSPCLTRTGRNGKCVQLRDCDLKIFNELDEFPLSCSNEFTIAGKVCCPIKVQTTRPAVTMVRTTPMISSNARKFYLFFFDVLKFSRLYEPFLQKCYINRIQLSIEK